MFGKFCLSREEGKQWWELWREWKVRAEECQSIKGERVTVGITEVVIKAMDLRGELNSGCRGSWASETCFINDSDGLLVLSHFMVKIQQDKFQSSNGDLAYSKHRCFSIYFVLIADMCTHACLWRGQNWMSGVFFHCSWHYLGEGSLAKAEVHSLS